MYCAFEKTMKEFYFVCEVDLLRWLNDSIIYWICFMFKVVYIGD